MTDVEIAVVGGGLAGLETARQLADADREVVVYEAGPSVGGRVQSDRTDGFTLDRGFQVLFTAYPEAKRVLSYPDLDLHRFPPGAIVCRPNHRSVVADPLRDPFRAVETVFSRDLTLRDKLQIFRLRQSLVGRSRAEIFAGPDETIEAFLRARGFSDRFIESVAAPFYGGITLDRSLQASSRLFQFTFSMLAEGAAAIPAEGMQAIPRQVAARAREQGARIQTNAAVESIDGNGPVTLWVDGKSVTADTVVVAAGPAESKRLTGIETIPTTGRRVRTQYFELQAGNPIADQPRIHLNAEGPVPNQVVSLSAVAPSYAPAERSLLGASTPGEPSVTDAELADRTRRAIASWYPAASFEDLRLLETVDVPFAQYAQPPGIHESLPSVGAPEGSVFLAGDYTSDSSINGALRSARQAATAIL